MAALLSITSIYDSMASFFTPSSLFIFLNLVIATLIISSRFTSKKPNQPEEFRHDNPYQLRRSSSLLDRLKSLNFGLYKFDYEPVAATEHVEPVYDSPQLVRTPSLLERVRSLNFGMFKYEQEPVVSETQHVQPEFENRSPKPDDPPQEPLFRTPSLLERLKSINFSHLYRSDSTKEAEIEPEVDAHDSSPDHDSGDGHENLVKRSKSEGHEESRAMSAEKMTKSASERSGFRKCKEDEDMVEQGRPATSRPALEQDDEVDAKADDFINRFKQHLKLQRLDSLLRRREMSKGY